MKTKIGIIGYGALAHIFLDLYEEHLQKDYEIVGILALPEEELSARHREKGLIMVDHLSELIEKRPKFIVEIAGASAVDQYGKTILNSEISLVLTSVGALADACLQEELTEAAKTNHQKVHIISGAIGGFDLFQTLALSEDLKVLIQNQKAPKSLMGAPGVANHQFSQEREVVFQGNAKEAIDHFPKNVNVAVAASLATVGVDKAQVEVISDPSLTRNVHRISVETKIGQMDLEVSSNPDPKNPKSSVITAYSIAALLKNLKSPLCFF